MRYINKYVILFVLFIGVFASCEKKLDEWNENPEVSANADPDYQLNYIQMVMLGNHHESWHMNIGMMSGIAQHIAGAWEMGPARAVYSGHEYSYLSWWQNSWSTTYKNVVDLVERTKDDEDLVNVNSAARILKVFTFARLTDAFGDIPYFDAGKGYYEGIYNVAYDTQEEIYYDFFVELNAAVIAFDESRASIKIDAMFNGNLDQWRKFANSLRMRLAMRLVKVDISKAEQEVKAAIAAPGGLMTSNADIAMIKHMSIEAEDIRNNPNSQLFERSGYSEFGVCSSLSDELLNTNDPRLDVLFAAYDGRDNSNPNWVDVVGYNGLAPASYAWDAPYLEGTDGEWRGYYEGGYLMPHKQIIDKDDPSFLLTYAEVQFYLAEAVQRGWASGDAASYYNAGVEAAMGQLSLYGLESDITNTQINDYLAANAYNPANGIEMINTQLWINHFLNGHEAFANWRRSGFPELNAPEAVDWEPQLVPGSPRRVPYLDSEMVTNPEGIAGAIQRLEAQGATAGARYMDGRVWWDAN